MVNLRDMTLAMLRAYADSQGLEVKAKSKDELRKKIQKEQGSPNKVNSLKAPIRRERLHSVKKSPTPIKAQDSLAMTAARIIADAKRRRARSQASKKIVDAAMKIVELGNKNGDNAMFTYLTRNPQGKKLLKNFAKLAIEAGSKSPVVARVITNNTIQGIDEAVTIYHLACKFAGVSGCMRLTERLTKGLGVKRNVPATKKRPRKEVLTSVKSDFEAGRMAMDALIQLGATNTDEFLLSYFKTPPGRALVREFVMWAKLAGKKSPLLDRLEKKGVTMKSEVSAILSMACNLGTLRPCTRLSKKEFRTGRDEAKNRSTYKEIISGFFG